MTKNRLTVLVAGDSQKDIVQAWGLDGWHLLTDNGFVERSSVSAVGFCRDAKRELLFVVLPKAFASALSDKQTGDAAIRNYAYGLLRLLNKIRKREHLALEKTLAAKTRSEVRVASSVLDVLEAALALREDYKANGLYLRKSTRPRVGRSAHPINWAQTRARHLPQLHRGQMFFPQYVHNERTEDASSLLTQLHLIAMKEIADITGEQQLVSDHRHILKSISLSVLNNPLGATRRASSEVFDERGRFLLGCCRAYFADRGLKRNPLNRQDDLLAYSTDFENIWEYVLRELFHSRGSKRALTAGEWVEYPTSLRREGIVPIIDAVAHTDFGTVVLDAKDYRIYSARAPWKADSSDYYQQMIYRRLMEAEGQPKTVSVLLFPGFSLGSMFRIHGYHWWTEIPKSRVFEVSVDYEIATKCWMKENRIDARGELARLVNQLSQFV
jgi:hypothetical protein